MKTPDDYMVAFINGLLKFDKNCDEETRVYLIEKLEEVFDDLDCDDFFGTEGWKHYFGLED